MSPEILLTFVAACILLGLTPGPHSLIRPTRCRAVCGQLGHADRNDDRAGTAGRRRRGRDELGHGVHVRVVRRIRWIGALYLVYLGARQLWLFRRRASGAALPRRVAGANLYFEGLLVSLSNPKVLLFLGAFLPQFVDPARDPLSQLWVLAVLFVVALAAVDVAYTLMVAPARATFDAARLRLLDGAAGVLLLLGGLALAMARRP